MAVARPPRNVLFLCTGNSARSVIAEAILRHEGQGRFRAYSAGSRPMGAVHPMALEVLRENGLSTNGLHSKGWDTFAQPDAPRMDVVITVCDAAAREACPVWPGAPITAHWGLADPAAMRGSDVVKRAAFRDTFAALERRIRALVSLDDGLAPGELATALQAAGPDV